MESPIRMMKPKKTFLLLLIGAAVILTVIWSTRNVSKPTFLQTVTEYDTFRQLPINQSQDSKSWWPTSSVSPAEGLLDISHRDQFHSEKSQQQCSIIQNQKPDIDTSDVYPTLNFNVSLNFQFWTECEARAIV